MPSSTPLTEARQAPLFASLRPVALTYLTDHIQVAQYPTGEMIIGQGMPAGGLYIIASGWVQVLLGSGCIGMPGDMALAEYGPGDVFGEGTLLEDEDSVTRAVALEPATCFVLYRHDLQTMLERFPSVNRALVSFLSGRLREAHRRIIRDTKDPLTNLSLTPRLPRKLYPPSLVSHQMSS